MFQIWILTAFDVPATPLDQTYTALDEAMKKAQELVGSALYPKGTRITVVEDLGQPTREVIREYIV